MIKKCIGILSFFCCSSLFAQDYFPKNDGVKTTNTNYTAFTHAKIHVSSDNTINNGILLIKDGKVLATGTDVKIPKNTKIINLEGKSIYPSFIDMYSDFGIEKPKSAGGNRGQTPQYDASRTGYYWNDHVMPENEALSKFKYDSKKAKALLDAGFGVVSTHIQDGIHRGTGTLVALNNKNGNETRILKENSAQYLSFSRSALSRQAYPNSIMGSIALLRQLYNDAAWYKKGLSKTKDLSIEALNKNEGLVQIFEAGDKTNILRADKIGDQFGIQYVILGGGDEYERIDDIKNTNASLILPINFQYAYDVENSFLTSALELSDMRAWNQEPTNPKVLADNNINFALTTHLLKSPTDFKEKLMEAIKYGLPKDKALEALTSIPAELLEKLIK